MSIALYKLDIIIIIIVGRDVMIAVCTAVVIGGTDVTIAVCTAVSLVVQM